MSAPSGGPMTNPAFEAARLMAIDVRRSPRSTASAARAPVETLAVAPTYASTGSAAATAQVGAHGTAIVPSPPIVEPSSSTGRWPKWSPHFPPVKLPSSRPAPDPPTTRPAAATERSRGPVR